MNTNRQSALIEESKMKKTTSHLIRWAGVSAMVAGSFFVIVGLFHPVEMLSTVTTTRWAIVHLLATAMCFFGVIGMAGLYARQAKESGWLGLVGYLLLSLWYVLTVGFTFTEVFILPLLATTAPMFVEGFLGMFNGHPGAMNMGVLPVLWNVTGPVYILGGLLFGIATFRAGILSRWAAVLLAVAAVSSPAGALLPHELKALVAVPVGLALVWLGYSLWSQRRAHVSEPISSLGSPQLGQTGAD